MMRPPGFRKRSRASATNSMVFSVSKQKELSVSVNEDVAALREADFFLRFCGSE